MSSAYAWSGAPHGTSPGAGHGGRADRVSSQISHGHANMCTGARQRGRNGLRYYSPTGIPSHTAHRIEGRGKKGEQGSRRRLAHSPASDVKHTSDVETRESPGSGTLGVAVLGQGRLTQPQPARSQPPCLVPSCLIPTINKHIVLVHVNRLHARGELSLRGALLHLGIDSVPSTCISGLKPITAGPLPAACSSRAETTRIHRNATRSQTCVPFWTRLEVTCLFSLLDANSRSQHYTS